MEESNIIRGEVGLRQFFTIEGSLGRQGEPIEPISPSEETNGRRGKATTHSQTFGGGESMEAPPRVTYPNIANRESPHR